jgi:hypothetical protein
MSALYSVVMYSLVFGVMAVMFGISGRARQSIKPRHNQHVTSLKPACLPAIRHHVVPLSYSPDARRKAAARR